MYNHAFPFILIFLTLDTTFSQPFEGIEHEVVKGSSSIYDIYPKILTTQDYLFLKLFREELKLYKEENFRNFTHITFTLNSIFLADEIYLSSSKFEPSKFNEQENSTLVYNIEKYWSRGIIDFSEIFNSSNYRAVLGR